MMTACNKDDGTQDKTDQELRFFDLYLASHYPDATLLEDNLYYQEHRVGTGNAPGEEEWMMVNFVGYEIPEDNVYISYLENVVEDNNLDPNGTALYGPYKMLNGSVNEGFTKGVMNMKEGGEATILFPSSLGFGSTGGGVVGSYTSLKYEIELLEVIPDIEAYEQDKINAYMDTVTHFQTIMDEGTGATMYYMIDRATDGQMIETDSAVSLAYTGMLLDGRVFDSKDADNPYDFTMGEESWIVGWNLVMPLLREGEKARLLIPYPIAYGVEGKVNQTSGLRAIPPYETLLFEIEVLSVGAATDDNNEIPVE
ncbi:MAG: FKBP-type peptidyl-prolyl cis-trans isomerase [Bacteroidales bacterium]